MIPKAKLAGCAAGHKTCLIYQAGKVFLNTITVGGESIRAVGCLVVAAFKTLIALAIYNLDGNTNFCWSKDRQKLEALLIGSC